jgi:hypothetical protein
MLSSGKMREQDPQCGFLDPVLARNLGVDRAAVAVELRRRADHERRRRRDRQHGKMRWEAAEPAQQQVARQLGARRDRTQRLGDSELQECGVDAADVVIDHARVEAVRFLEAELARDPDRQALAVAAAVRALDRRLLEERRSAPCPRLGDDTLPHGSGVRFALPHALAFPGMVERRILSLPGRSGSPR